MNTNHKYDPEDIESLLMHKQYNELFDDEKEFVLQHVKNEEEYNSLRSMLFTLHDQAYQEEWLEPDPSIKKELLKEFAVEKKGGFLVWLNSIFVLPEVKFYQRPAYQLAFATALVLIGGVWFISNRNSNEIDDLASRKVESGAIDTASVMNNNNLFAENLSNQQLPPAPKTIEIPDANNSLMPVAPEVVEELPVAVVEDVQADAALEPAGNDDVNISAPLFKNTTSKDQSDRVKESLGQQKKEAEETTAKTNNQLANESENFDEVKITDNSVKTLETKSVVITETNACSSATISL